MKWILVVASLLVSPAWADGTPVRVGTASRIIISNNMITDGTISGIRIRGNTFYYGSNEGISIGPEAELPTPQQLDRERDQVWDDWLRARGYRK